MAKVVKRSILVEIGYYDFVFDDLIAANAFAAVSKSHLAERSDTDVRITIDYEEQEEEEQEDDSTTN